MMRSENGVLEKSSNYFSTAGTNVPDWFLTLLCTGLYFCDGRYLTRRTGYESGLIMQVLEGRGYVLCNGREQVLRAGDMCLIDCFSPHAYGTRTGWKILWVHFAGSPARGICASVEGGVKILRPGSAGLELNHLLHSLFHQFEGGPKLDSAKTHSALTSLICAFFGADTQADSTADIDRVTAYLSENLSQDITNALLAQIAHMSESQLIRLFQQHTGSTPHQYLLQLRLNAAQYYLASTDMKLSEVAAQCGFTDASALTNRFRKVFGVTPREYARRSTGPSENGKSE